MTILVLAPMPIELRPFERDHGLHRASRGGMRAATGVIGSRPVTAVVAGIGMDRSAASTRLAIELVQPEHVVVSGIAGGLDPSLAIGDLHVPAVALDVATGTTYPATPLGTLELRGVIRSSDELLPPAAMAAHVDGTALSVDMETAAIAAVCVELGLPWTAFRGISDLVADGHVGNEVLALTNPDGSAKVGAGIRYVLTHPHRLPRLMALARGGSLAAKVAAAATADAIRASS